MLDRQTHKIARLTHSSAYDHQAAWGPGGHRLVFERDTSTSSSIFMINTDGSDLHRLSSGAFLDTGPAFSPDGSLIAFGSDRAGGFRSDLWVMRDGGTNTHPVRIPRYGEGFPDWQPVR